MVKVVIMDLKSEKTGKAEQKVSISIHPKPRRKEAKLRRKMNQAANRIMRADINREYRGETGSKKAGEYHEKMKALSLGLLHG